MSATHLLEMVRALESRARASAMRAERSAQLHDVQCDETLRIFMRARSSIQTAACWTAFSCRAIDLHREAATAQTADLTEKAATARQSAEMSLGEAFRWAKIRRGLERRVRRSTRYSPPAACFAGQCRT